MNKPKILIIGGNGYIGGELFKYFYKKNYPVLVSCRKNNDIILDLKNYDEIRSLIFSLKPDVIINATSVGGRRIKEDNAGVLHENLLCFENLLRVMEEYSIPSSPLKYFNFTSGADSNRNYNINTIEYFPSTLPQDYYGLSKYIITKRLMRSYDISSSGLRTYNLRLFNIFNENEGNDRFIKTCINKLMFNNSFDIFQNKLFDFFYMEDLGILIEELIKDLECYWSYKIYKEINCVYEKKYDLISVALKIRNKLNSKGIINLINTEMGNSYIGYYGEIKKYSYLFTGLNEGINKTIKALEVPF